MRPFPFLGHGRAAPSAKLWIALAEPEASAAPLLTRLSHLKNVGGLQRDGLVVQARFKALADTAERDQALLAAHAQVPLSLVVQPQGTSLSSWHEESLADVERILAALERLVRAADTYLVERRRLTGWSGADVNAVLLKAFRGQAPRAELVLAALARLTRGHKGTARAILTDQLMERLPGLAGHDFDVDLVLRHHLALAQKLSPSSIRMPEKFNEGLALRLRGPKPSRAPAGVEQLHEAIAAKDWRRLGRALRADDEAHVQVLLALPPARLRAIAEFGLSTPLANAGVHLMVRGRFADALKLYDAVMCDAKLEASTAANPLYAVQDDNNHLGVDEARARRYLERCLPLGPENPAIFLNAAFVWMELDEHEAALDALAQAKARGLQVKAHRDERVLAPLRDRPAFKKLMR